jgi:hypothetical protein
MPEYGKPRSAGTRGRSNRQTVQWVPVTELSFARSVLAARAVGIDLAVWLDEAIAAHLVKTRHEVSQQRYRAACEQAAETRRPTPTRHEFGQTRRRMQPVPEVHPQGGAERSRSPGTSGP